MMKIVWNPNCSMFPHVKVFLSNKHNSVFHMILICKFHKCKSHFYILCVNDKQRRKDQTKKNRIWASEPT